MGKKKKGRPRGRGGPGIGPGRGRPRPNWEHRPHHQQQRHNSGSPDTEPVENGEALPLEPACGVLELHPNGYGFLRDPKNNYQRERTDPFVPGAMIEKFALREGVLINGMVQHQRKQ